MRNMKDPHPVMRSCQPVTNCASIIRRTVIDENNFNVWVCLREHTANCFLEELASIVDGNYRARLRGQE